MSAPTTRPTAFHHDAGWVQLPQFLTTAEIEQTISVCQQLLQTPPSQRRAGDKPIAGTHHLFELDDRSSFIRQLLERRELLNVVGEILGPSFTRDQASYRSPQPSFGGQFLHADAPPMLHPGPATVATAIVALTAFTQSNGATRLIPGSHQRPDLQREAGRMERHDGEILLVGNAGTAFVFSGHVLHSGTTNTSQRERPALQLVWSASR